MKKYLLPLLFVVSMLALDLYPGTQDIFRDGKIRAILLLGSLFMFFYYSKVVGIGVAAFISYSVIQTILANYPIYGYFSASLMVVVPFVCYSLVKYIGHVDIGRWIVCAAVIQAIFGLLQFYFGIHVGFQPLMESDMFEAVGTMGQHTVLGSFLAISLAPALWRKAYVGAAVIMWSIVTCLSSMATGTMFFVLGLYLWKVMGHKKMIALWAVIAITGLIVYLNNPLLYFYKEDHSVFHTMGRSTLWPVFWPAVKERPIFGGGVGWFSYWSIVNVGNKYGALVWDKVHCDGYQALIEQGIVGLSMLAYGLYEFFKKMRLEWPQVLVLAMLLNSIANFPFHLMTHAVLFCIAWIISLNLEREESLYVHA